MQVQFDSPPVFGDSIPDPSQDAIENTLNLRQVGLEDAVRYGGSITKAALGAMNFSGDRDNIIVDTKVHMLLPGFMPAIPGWHTDGVPRGDALDPAGKGGPRFDAQVEHERLGLRPPRYHLLVTGTHSPTKFLTKPFTMNIDPAAGADLYRDMTDQVNDWLARTENATVDIPASTVATWDWWSIHTAQAATTRGWRYLIRVTETDSITPRTDPSDFIRTQNQVYIPASYGW